MTSRRLTGLVPKIVAGLMGPAVAMAVISCADVQDEEGANELWQELQQVDYRDQTTGWSRAPGYPGREESNTAHGDEVEIFINPTISGVLQKGEPVYELPVSSLIVKEVYKGGELKLIAAMEKQRPGDWFWAEWDPQGKVVFAGRPGLCIDCHKSGDDYIRAFPLPKE